MVLLIQFSIIFLEIRQADEVGSGVFLGDFVAQARSILASVWRRGGNCVTEGR
jgi:hypothetical protein